MPGGAMPGGRGITPGGTDFGGRGAVPAGGRGNDSGGGMAPGGRGIQSVFFLPFFLVFCFSLVFSTEKRKNKGLKQSEFVQNYQETGNKIQEPKK